MAGDKLRKGRVRSAKIPYRNKGESANRTTIHLSRKMSVLHRAYKADVEQQGVKTKMATAGESP